MYKKQMLQNFVITISFIIVFLFIKIIRRMTQVIKNQEIDVISQLRQVRNKKQSQLRVKEIVPLKSEKLKIDLNQSGSAYLLIQFISEELIQKAQDTFSQMWEIHPLEKHKIIMFQKELQMHRYSKSYLNTPISTAHTNKSSYMYSGYDTSNNRGELPQVFMPYYRYIKQQDEKFNQVIANWYEGKNDYIARHSDCQIGMIQNAQISILSLYPKDDVSQFRTLNIAPKHDTKSPYDKYQIRLDQGSIVTMCGTVQNQFKHGIAKQAQDKCPRISLSFRQMKDDL